MFLISCKQNRTFPIGREESGIDRLSEKSSRHLTDQMVLSS